MVLSASAFGVGAFVVSVWFCASATSSSILLDASAAMRMPFSGPTSPAGACLRASGKSIAQPGGTPNNGGASVRPYARVEPDCPGYVSSWFGHSDAATSSAVVSGGAFTQFHSALSREPCHSSLTIVTSRGFVDLSGFPAFGT